MFKILVRVKHNMRINPHLELTDDPDRINWAYFSIRKVVTMVIDHFLLVMLTIPLFSESLQIDLYKMQNIPALHPDLSIQFS